MSTPGANRSLHEPGLENDARASADVDAATVITSGTRAGVWSQLDVVASLPADATTVMPSPIIACTASSKGCEAAVLRLRLATAGTPSRCALRIHWIPASRIVPVVVRLQSKTFTATIQASLATPHVEPPTMPATW